MRVGAVGRLRGEGGTRPACAQAAGQRPWVSAIDAWRNRDPSSRKTPHSQLSPPVVCAGGPVAESPFEGGAGPASAREAHPDRWDLRDRVREDYWVAVPLSRFASG